MKKSQTMSIEAYIAIVIFLIAIIVFYVATSVKSKPAIEKEAEDITQAVSSNEMFEDGELSEEDIETLLGMDCNELKKMLKTNKNICIYFKDTNGNIITLNKAAVEKYGIGCPIIDVSGVECGKEVY